MIRVCVPVMVVALASGACRVQEVPRPERVAASDVAREEIRSTLTEYRAALLRGEPAAIAEFFTADAQLYGPDSPDLIGIRDIRDAITRFHRMGQVLDVTIEREAIDIADGGFAYEMGTFTRTFTLAADTAHQTQRSRYAIRWQRGAEASWRIHRFLVTHYSPADTAATTR